MKIDFRWYINKVSQLPGVEKEWMWHWSKKQRGHVDKKNSFPAPAAMAVPHVLLCATECLWVTGGEWQEATWKPVQIMLLNAE